MGRKLKKLPKAQRGLLTGLKNIIKPISKPILPSFNTGILPMGTTKIGNMPSLNFTDWADLMKKGNVQSMFPSFYSQAARQHIIPPNAPWNEFAANNLTGDLIRREINRGDGLAFDRGLMISPAQNTGRKSVHFSSSGKPVVGHHMGDWSHAGTSFTLPISDAIRYNAMPRSVSLNDTYWYNPRQFVYPPSTKVFTGDMGLASNTRGIGLETTFSKDAMKLTKEINRINEMKWTPGGKLNYNETTGAGNFNSKKYNDYISLMTPLKNEMDLLHSNWLSGLNLKGINANDPRYLLGARDFKPNINTDAQRSVRSDRAVPYTHSESPEFQLGYNKGTRLNDGTLIKDKSQRITLPDGRTMLDSYSLKDKIYGTKNFKDVKIKPSQSDLVIFQKEVFGYPKDYAELLLKRYDAEGLPKDSQFREILDKYVTDGTSHIKYQDGGGLLKAQAGIPKSLLRLVPPKYRGNALSYLRKTYPNLDLRGNAPFVGGSSNIGVNELNLTNKNLMNLTDYEKGSLSFLNQQNLQPNSEFSNILQNYQHLNTDKNLALSLGNFASENPNAYFELLTQGTPSSTLTDMFKNPSLNIFNAQNKYVNMETPSSTSPYAGNQRDNWTDEFEKNLRTYGNSGLFASNVPLMGPTSINKINVDPKNILKKGFAYSDMNIPQGYTPYDLTSTPGYSFNQTVSPTAHYMATNSLMNPDPIRNATRFRGSGDIANQHNFLMNMANKPSLILSGDKGYVGGPGSIENRMFYGGLDRPLPGKNVSSANQSIIPQLTETFNLNQPFSGTFMKFPTTQTINRHFDGSIVGGNNNFLTNLHTPYENFYPGLQLPSQTIFKKNFSLTNPFGQRGFIDQSGNPIDPNILPNFPSQVKQKGGELPKAQSGAFLKTLGKKIYNNTINPKAIQNPIGRFTNTIMPYNITPKSKLLIPGRTYGDVSHKMSSLVSNYQKEFSPMVWATGMSRHNLDEGSLFADGMTSRITQFMEPGTHKLNEPVRLMDGNTRFWLGESMNKNWDDFYRGVQYQNQHLFPEIKDLNLNFGYRPDKSAAWFYPDGTEYKDLPIPSAITKEYGGQTPWLSLDTKPDRLYKKGGEAKRTSITSYQNGGSIHPNQQVDYMKMFSTFIKEQEAGVDYMKNKDSSVMKPDGSGYYKMYEDGVFYPYYYENTDGTFEETATIGYGTKGENIYQQYKEGMSIEEANMELQKSIDEAFRRSSIYINGNYGENTWSNLPVQKQVMLADYAYNVGALSKFPNYTKAIMTNDTDLALKEYLRSESKGGNKITRNESYLNTFLQPWVDQTISTKKETAEKEKLNLLNDTKDGIMKNKYDNWYSPFVPNTIENLWKTNYDWEDQYWKDKNIKTYQEGGEQKYSNKAMEAFMNYQKMIQSGFSEDLRNDAAQTYIKILKKEGIDVENMSQSDMFNLARTASEKGYVMPTETYGDNPPTPQFIYNGNPISIEEGDDPVGAFAGNTKLNQLGDKVSQIPSSYFIDKKIKSEDEYHNAIKEYFKDDQDATRFLRDLEEQNMLGEIPALMNRESINALRDYSNPEFNQEFADYLEYEKATDFLTNDEFFNKPDGWSNYSKNYNEKHTEKFTSQYINGFGFDHKQKEEFLDYMKRGHTGNELYDNMITGLNKNIEHYNIGNIAGTGYKTPKGLLGTGDSDLDLSTLKQGEYPHYLLDHRLAAWNDAQSPSGSIIRSDYNVRENRYDTDWESNPINKAWSSAGDWLKGTNSTNSADDVFNFLAGDVLYGTVDWALNTAGGLMGIDDNRYEAGERFWENPTPGNFAGVGIDMASFLPVGKLLKFGKNALPGAANTGKFLTQNLKNTPGWQNKVQLFKNNADDLYNFNKTMKNPSWGGGPFSNINTGSTLFPNNSLAKYTKPGYSLFTPGGWMKPAPLLGTAGTLFGTSLLEQSNPDFFDGALFNGDGNQPVNIQNTNNPDLIDIKY